MKESEIRPDKLFDEYLRLAEQDTRIFFDYLNWSDRPCPACGRIGIKVFNKSGFNYCRCSQCLTLFVSPMPPPEAFKEFYTNGTSTQFWSTNFYKETELARREKIWKPKAKKVHEILAKYNALDGTLFDIGGGYGTFVEEYACLGNLPATVIEPSPTLAKVCREKGLSVIQLFFEQVNKRHLTSSRKIFTCFELFEHLDSPLNFVRHLYGLMNKGDIFVMTTLSGTGFDIELLGEHSKAVTPPHHVNFFNPSSLALFLQDLGFDIVHIETPGQLDVDIAAKQADRVSDKFWRAFLNKSTQEDRDRLQSALVENHLSSHMLLVCTKS